MREPLPIISMGDFNAHHPYWLDKDVNKLGNELFDFLVDKSLVVANNSQPTRKDKIIDLTIMSNSLQEKVTTWRVMKEVYLNTDHSLITVKAPNIAHLSLLTSVGYNKKETKLKKVYTAK